MTEFVSLKGTCVAAAVVHCLCVLKFLKLCSEWVMEWWGLFVRPWSPRGALKHAQPSIDHTANSSVEFWSMAQHVNMSREQSLWLWFGRHLWPYAQCQFSVVVVCRSLWPKLLRVQPRDWATSTFHPYMVAEWGKLVMEVWQVAVKEWSSTHDRHYASLLTHDHWNKKWTLLAHERVCLLTGYLNLVIYAC